MKKIIILKKEENENLILLVEDGVLVERHSENIEKRNIEGNIYIGKVQNVLPGLGSAFVNIGKNRNAFIAAKDILPKVDITKGNSVNNEEITKLIKPGDPILVQIKKDTCTKKGVRVTTHLNIPGRFIVLCPNTPFITVSSKIEEKDKVKEIVEKNLENGLGAIIRTNAENASEKEILEDIERLTKEWKKIKNAKIESFPKQVYDTGGIIKKIIIDMIDCGLDEIIVQEKSMADEVENILKSLNKYVEVRIDNDNILYNYNLDRQIKDAEKRKIWLKNGGFITIEKTEALTAIDVNSAKETGKDTNVEETIYNVNYEATIEILKQLRLRDIGGIIIIDYIDMHIKENKQKILDLINSEIKKDRSKVQLEGFTKLNLVEMTRKHLYHNSF